MMRWGPHGIGYISFLSLLSARFLCSTLFWVSFLGKHFTNIIYKWELSLFMLFQIRFLALKAKEKFPHAITLNEDLSFDASQGCTSDISINKVVFVIWSNAVYLNNHSDVNSSKDQSCVSQNHRKINLIVKAIARIILDLRTVSKKHRNLSST